MYVGLRYESKNSFDIIDDDFVSDYIDASYAC